MSATLNTKIQPNTRVCEFLELIFRNKRDLFCAKIILSSLPFEVFGGGQKKILEIIKEQEDPIVTGTTMQNPSAHYWRTIKKLLKIGMVVEVQDWNRNATRKTKWYNKDSDSFIKFLNSVSVSWARFCRGET